MRCLIALAVFQVAQVVATCLYLITNGASR